MTINRIPKQLQNPEFRFIPLEGKMPILPNWTQNNFKFDDPKFQDLIQQRNYGVVCGYGNLIVIDVDNPSEEVVNLIESNLPETFTVLTGGRGLHYYYIIDELIDPKKLDIGTCHIDLQSKGRQVVAPGSIHPETKRVYSVLKDVPIAKITREQLYNIFLQYFNPTQTEESKKYEHLLEKILLKLNYKERPNYYIANCPFHPPDKNPSFAIYKNSLLAVDFHNDQIYNLKQLALKLGIEIEEKKFVLLDKFNAKLYAEEILKEYKFIYDIHKRFWRYDPLEGIWKEDAEQFLKKVIREKLLGDESQKTHYVNEIKNYIQDISYIDKDPFVPNPNLIAFKNVVYDLEQDKFISFSPDLYLTSKIEVFIDENYKTCPNIDKFFIELVGEDKKQILYELIAYTLYKEYPYQKFFILYGSGQNGKSTYLNLLAKFLGEENISSENPQDLTTKEFSIGNLFNKLANISSDIPYDLIKNADKIKGLVGGDLMTCNRKYKQPFPFRNYAKLIFSTNLVPATTDKSYAFYRRIYLIEFPNTFKNPDPELLKKLTTPEELSGMAWKLIETLKQMKARSWRFSYDPDPEEVKVKYEKLSNPIARFIEENCVIDEQGMISVNFFYTEFKTWSEAKKLPLFGKTTVSRIMEDLGFHKQKRSDKNGRYYYIGLRWKQGREEEQITQQYEEWKTTPEPEHPLQEETIPDTPIDYEPEPVTAKDLDKSWNEDASRLIKEWDDTFL